MEVDALMPSTQTPYNPYVQSPSGYGYGGPPPVSQTGAGGGGAFPTGGAGPLYGMKTGGFGLMRQGASPYSQGLMGQAAERGWNMLGTGTTDPLNPYLRAQATSADTGRAMWEQQEGDYWGSIMRGQKLDLFKRLMSMLSGQGGPGGGGPNVPMPLQPDPQILAAQQADIEAAYEPLQRKLAASQAGRGVAPADSSAATYGQGILAGQKARAMASRYLPALQAETARYSPGLEAARIGQQGGQWNIQQLMQLLGGLG